MTVIAEERHYRRGLVLGLTISELMLLLLFLLLLLLSYLLQETERKNDIALQESTERIIQLEQINEKLSEEKTLLGERVVELREDINELIVERDEIKDDFDELVRSHSTMTQELAAANETINNTPGLEEIKELKEEAAKSQELQNENEELSEALSQKQTELDEAVKNAAQELLDGMYNSRKDLIDGVLSDLVQGGVENATPDYENGVLRLPQDVLFNSGEGYLSSSGEEAVDLLAQALRKWLPCYTVAHAWACQEQDVPENAAKLSAVFIEGHTDNKPVVKEETVTKYGDNWGLSSARAISAFKRLVSEEKDLQTYLNSEGQRLLSISGYADNRPAADNWTSEGREKNRRIDVRFIFVPNADAARSEITTGVSGAVPALAPKVSL